MQVVMSDSQLMGEHEVAKDEEGGEVVPVSVDEKAGRLRIMMTKKDCFAHGGKGGITKRAASALSC